MAKRKPARKRRRPTGKKARAAAPITIRISGGVVVSGERHVEVARKQRIRWKNLSDGDNQVVFGTSTDPFAPGKVIDVPGNGESEEEVIRGLPGTYKYSVLKTATGEVKDDPNIIIKS